MARLTGTWTAPGSPLPSSHLIRLLSSGGYGTRCGRVLGAFDSDKVTPEPPGTGKTCEPCLRGALRDS